MFLHLTAEGWKYDHERKAVPKSKEEKRKGKWGRERGKKGDKEGGEEERD